MWFLMLEPEAHNRAAVSGEGLVPHLQVAGKCRGAAQAGETGREGRAPFTTACSWDSPPLS